MKIYSFEKLNVWQKAQQLAVLVYKTTNAFPKEELFGLSNQMRRSAVSVSSNIAEGTGRLSAKDKSRFTVIAYSSALELLNQTIICNQLNFISNDTYQTIRKEIDEITIMLDSLHKSQIKINS